MKKLTALLTAVIMLIASFTSVFAAFSDVDDSNPYREAISTLSTLSVIDGYEDGTFRPDGAIKRSEFTKLIVYMLGLQDLKYPSYSFDDVEPSYWGANFIQTAYDRGIIVGFEDGSFHPEDPVTYAQALKMVVCTLGYEQFAMTRTPTGDDWANLYIQQASELGLQKNITGAGYYDDASRGIIAQMLYNALEVPVYENNGYNWVKTDKTLLGDFLKVKELKGTLIGAQDDVTEECTHKLNEDEMDILTNSGEEVLINYSSYANKSEIAKYLGSKIRVFYRQMSEKDDKTLVSIDADSSKNTVIELNYDDIAEITDTNIKYYDNTNKAKSIKLKPNDMTVRYNGRNISSDTSVDINGISYTRQEALMQWLNPDSENFIYGTVSLTDNSNDGTVDMIQIYNYNTLVALSAPNSSDYRITDKLVTGNGQIFDPQSGQYDCIIKKDGNDIPVTSIAANDVVLWAESLDGDLYTLLVSSKTVQGTVSSINSDNSRMTISGNTYDIGPKCIDYIEKNNKTLKAGVTGTFYLDALGTIVFGTITEAAAAPYAYITNTYMEDSKYYVTVYAPNTSASGAVSYPLKANVKVNGSNMKAESATSRIREAASNAKDESAYAKEIYGAADKLPISAEYDQPARVSISNGEVTSIVLLTSDEILAQNEDTDKIVLCKDIEPYTFSANSFNTKDNKTAFSVNSSTVIIYVPQDRSQKNKYAKKSISSAFTSGETYYLQAYDINSSKTANLIILYGNDGTLTKVKKDTDFSVVATLPQSTYSEAKDETVNSFDVYSGTNITRKWTTYDDEEFKDIEVGDVIQFAYDSDNLAQGRINNIRFADIAEILDGKEVNGQLYNWEEKQTADEEHNYQEWKFDYRFKKAGTDKDEEFTSSTLGTVPYSRAAIFNVSQVLPEENKIYVTKGGFENDLKIDDTDYEEVLVTPATKILRMEDERNEISRYISGTSTDLTINDLRSAKDYGVDCSKILVCFQKGVAKLIVIYPNKAK